MFVEFNWFKCGFCFVFNWCLLDLVYEKFDFWNGFEIFLVLMVFELFKRIIWVFFDVVDFFGDKLNK